MLKDFHFQIFIAEIRKCYAPVLINGWVDVDQNISGNSFIGKFRYETLMIYCLLNIVIFFADAGLGLFLPEKKQ